MLTAAPRQTELPRPRLVQKLRRAAEHRLTLVTAPPGYGKTTALTQFAQAVPYPVAWHSLEPRERDLACLCSHSLNALQDVCPDIGKLRPTGTPDEMAVQIANFLGDALREDMVYVLDDAHIVEHSPAAHRWLRTLLE